MTGMEKSEKEIALFERIWYTGRVKMEESERRNSYV